METTAKLRNTRSSPYKIRLVANEIRGKKVEDALNMLTFNKKKAAFVLKGVLMSAVANAENNEGADIDELRVSAVSVDQGPTYKRWRARAKGRANQILKRTSHIQLTVSDS